MVIDEGPEPAAKEEAKSSAPPPPPTSAASALLNSKGIKAPSSGATSAPAKPQYEPLSDDE